MAAFGEERQASNMRGRLYAPSVVVCALLLSLLTVFVQVKHLGLSWHETEYRAQLERIASGNVTSPDAQCPLSAWLARGLIDLFERAGVPRGGGLALIAIRLGQNLALFLLALALYRRLGIHPYLGLLGLSAVAWGMTQSHDSAGLALDIYTEAILYLFAAWVVIARNPWWVVPITVIAAINRETSVLIPAVLLGDWPSLHAVDSRGTGRSAGILPAISSSSAPSNCGHPARAPVKWLILVFCGALVSWVLSRGLVSVVQGFSGASSEGYWALSWACLNSCQRLDFWTSLVGIFGIVPVIALLGWRAWPPVLKIWFWVFGPVWVLVNIILDPIGTHHAWILPQLLVFVPALLLFIASLHETARNESTD